MKQLGLSFVALAALAACAPSFSPDTAVSYKEILRMSEKQPYECAQYDAASDTCEVVSTIKENRDGTVAVRSQFQANIFAPATITIDANLTPDGARLCGDYKNVGITVDSNLTAGENRDLAEILRQTLQAYGTVCGAYYRRGAGIVAVSEYPDGRLVEDQPVLGVQFFPEAKPLRDLQP
ncbi:hypothetical protein [Nereida sp. MMG025]|uniref:hypothetical protein n=1 Tax=Nereida sp. MMG025 TaxID=2909981 RepID=UPI001F489C65|nr:hypothetical protein [Nereida sp. MMG025]MCF6444017.1 hypothetical protein [Nereida sp. MMG025]